MLSSSHARSVPRGTGVTPFGDPGITGCVLLPRAFRSLPRPSSPSGPTGIRHKPILHLAILPFPRAPSARVPSPSFPCHVKEQIMEIRGLEPLTLGLQSRCSSQLS